MTKFTIPKVNLEEELFIGRNIVLAQFAVLNALAQNEPTYRAEILGRLQPEQFTITFDRLLFESMVEMIYSQGHVDIDELRLKIRTFFPESPEFTEGCLVNFAQIISLNPTPEQVTRALEIITSPPPPLRFLKSKQDDQPK